jgi:hypothetical protein
MRGARRFAGVVFRGRFFAVRCGVLGHPRRVFTTLRKSGPSAQIARRIPASARCIQTSSQFAKAAVLCFSETARRGDGSSRAGIASAQADNREISSHFFSKRALISTREKKSRASFFP